MKRLFSFALFLVAIGWLYSWAPGSFPARTLSRSPTEFYPELSDALLHGHLHLARAPDPRLVALDDPYDPGRNAPYRVNNLSYFKGHYFLYMGVGPALALFIPVKLITGYYLSHELATIILCLVGVAASLGALNRLTRYSRFSVSPAVIGCGAVTLALANGFHVVQPGALAQEVAVAAAYAFGMVALWACAHVLTSGRPLGWLAAASVAFGGAIASRPNYVFASIALLPALLTCWVKLDKRWGWAGARLLLTAALPLSCVVLGLLAYNQARFGDIFEFGQHYALGSWNQRQLPNHAAGAVLGNAWQYLFSPGVYSRTFPFLGAPTSLAIGVLRNNPWLWLTPVAIVCLARKAVPGPLKAFGLSALLLSGTNLIVLLYIPSGNAGAPQVSANARYVLDFLPGLVLLVAVWIVTADGLSASLPRRRRWIACAAIPLASASALAGLSLDLGRFPPETYRPLSRILDLPDYAYESLRGPGFGPLRIDVLLPTGRTGAYEPLVTTGTREAANLLYIHYTSERTVQFGLIESGAKGPLSGPIPVDYGVVHHFDLSFGSLYPPVGYPTLAQLSEAQIAALKRNLHIAIDGRPVFDAVAYCDPAQAESVRVGENPFLTGYGSDRFSGRILAERRMPITAPADSQLPSASYGAVRLVLRFPSDKVSHYEPLVVTGVPQAGDFIYVHYLDRRHISLGLDHWGGSGAETPSLPIDFAVPHVVEISMGSLFPLAEHQLLSGLALQERDRLKQEVRVALDGKQVLLVDRATFESSSYTTTIGINAIGGSVCDYAFTGTIASADRLPLPEAPPSAP
jgi:hypothetical protein